MPKQESPMWETEASIEASEIVADYELTHALQRDGDRHQLVATVGETASGPEDVAEFLREVAGYQYDTNTYEVAVTDDGRVVLTFPTDGAVYRDEA